MRTALRDFWKLGEEEGDSLRKQFNLVPSAQPVHAMYLPEDAPSVVQVVCQSCAPRLSMEYIPDYAVAQKQTFVQVVLQFVAVNKFKKRDGTEVIVERFQPGWIGQCERCGQIYLGLTTDPTLEPLD